MGHNHLIHVTKGLVLILITTAILAACTNAAPTATPTQSPTSTPNPTNTPQPTSTPAPTNTPQPTATRTPEPTATPITIASLEAQMIGVETHGNMICITNYGNIQGVDVKLKATIQQGGVTTERQVPLEQVDVMSCFEMTDLMYKNGAAITVTIAPYLSSSVTGNILLDLGSYQAVPFLKWIFGENGLDRNVGGGFRNDHRAWDLRFSSDVFINSVGTPIYALGDGEILLYNYWYPQGNDKGYVTNLEAWLPDVGLLWQFGHITPTDKYPSEQRINIKFNVGDQLATIDVNQSVVSSFPHTHSAYQTVQMTDPLKVAYDQPIESYINPFSHDPMNDGSNLPTGFWLPDYLPPDVLELFQSGFFDQNTSVADYKPAPTK